MSPPVFARSISGGKVSFSAYVDQSEVVSAGIPFLIQFSSDRAPFPLVVVISVEDATGVERIELSGVYTDAKSQNNLADVRVIQDGHRFKSDNDDLIYFSESITDIVQSERPTRIRLTGIAIEKNDNPIPFDVELNVPFEREQQVYIGWMKLLYYDQF